MRSDRKKEERIAKKEKKASKKNGFCRAIAVIYSILVLCFIGLLLWLNVLPAKYLYTLIGVLIVISIFIVPVMYSHRGKTSRKRGAAFFAIILIITFGIGTYYLSETIGFFDAITEIAQAKEDFYLVVKADSRYKEASQLSGKTIEAYADADSVYSEARNQLKEEINIKYEYVDKLPDLLQNLTDEECPAIFISAASYESMKGENSQLEQETKIIYTISVAVKSHSRTSHVNVTKEPFNVLVSGLDITGDISNVSRSDVNMIVTVNPKTKQILLTSIPRDYYINLPKKGAMDKLTHSGLYGVQETIGAVEDFMGIEINYYVKVNYSTVTKLVDAIGGIDIDSPYSFSTHGMTDKYTFMEGYNHLDGSMALAYSRERQSWVDGDMRRNENQQLIIEAIIKKASSSTTILSDYTSILNAIKGNLETDLSKSDITSLIKMQLGDMADWTIEKQALKGEPASRLCYSLGLNASVVLPDDSMIAEALDKIMQVEDATE